VAELLDKLIAGVARTQHGYITRSQLLALGLGPSAIAYRVKIGRLIPVYRGVYAVGHVPLGTEARAHAAVLACGAGAVLSHGSAAGLWKYVKYWTPPPFEVTSRSKRRRPGITVHRSTTLTRKDVTRQLGVPVTSPARTVFDMAPRLGDKPLRRFMRDARLTHTLNRSDLAELLDRHPRHPATRRLEPFLDPTRAGGPTRSEFEDAFIEFAQRYGLPAPITNTRLHGYEVDALFPAERVIVELDGAEFHLDRDVFESDRDRDATLLAVGYLTIRITWERFTARSAREAARLRKILDARRRLAA
jgi:predicted transcriptional regulator of viral defense system